MVDSAFSQDRYPYLVNSCQMFPTDASHSVVLLNRKATLLHQSLEGGMRGLQGHSSS